MNHNNNPQNQEEKTPEKTGSSKDQNGLDMHSSKYAHDPQGGKGGRSSDNKSGENSNHDKNDERSIDGRRDS